MKTIALLAFLMPLSLIAQTKHFSMVESVQNTEHLIGHYQDSKVGLSVIDKPSTQNPLGKIGNHNKIKNSRSGFALNLISGTYGLKQNGFTMGINFKLKAKRADRAFNKLYAGIGAGLFSKSYTEKCLNPEMKLWESNLAGASIKVACRL